MVLSSEKNPFLTHLWKWISLKTASHLKRFFFFFLKTIGSNGLHYVTKEWTFYGIIGTQSWLQYHRSPKGIHVCSTLLFSNTEPHEMSKNEFHWFTDWSLCCFCNKFQHNLILDLYLWTSDCLLFGFGFCHVYHFETKLVKKITWSVLKKTPQPFIKESFK